MSSLPKTGFMRPVQVMHHFQISESTLWKWVRDGKFPKPDKLSDGVSRFEVTKIQAWLDARQNTTH